MVENRSAAGAARPLAMVVGPTRQAPSVLERLAAPALPLTDPAFLAEFGRCLTRLREVVGSTSAETVVTPGSGTIGMECSAVSLLRPGLPVLVVSTGTWGERWRRICLRNRVPAHAPRFAPGRAPDLGAVDRALRRRRHQAVLVAHVDSSSGVRSDVAGLTALAHRHGALCLVDGVSAIGAERVEVDDWDLDLYLGGPSKGLAAAPGLALYALGRRAVEALRDRPWEPSTFALDLAPWLPVMAAALRGRFDYFQSPAGNSVMALSEALRLVLAEGREQRVARHAALRDRLHAGLADLGIRLLVPEERDRANGVTVCLVPDDLREERLLAAVADEGVVLQAGTLPLARRRTFRLGHLGTVDDDDISRALAAVEAGLRACRRNAR
ncbi:aminotransferase class V-fold PLP-dependent enzyme [Saccharothrix algeriensis]|uniref:Alanine-glyoxylate transaminase/serine-glyoxylate transaminase/serine-pyruvate transaminase n=1 Tax=Saccharothrix algeriensis TaxID=173560 RepID=A0ABS2S5F6_9PSEU|nr:aminotransferase class V-fold PLP-dependent enzyme [Saccharothrix algeriensis]MBM7811075.1 alanine-glyoxylate transaminase/serine-glyoxylate transaminase/serine-pyruvate transaminase [Saccharothrix algeriensis]